MEIYISNKIAKAWPKTKLGVIEYEVTVKENDQKVKSVMDQVIEQCPTSTQEISQMTSIHDTREAYKAFGKSPSKYRNAAEAMLRRVINKKGLYTINNIVDINNIMSISTGYSIGSYDKSELEGSVMLDIAGKNAHYAGIGKEKVNIENLPVLFDDAGAFGNPTSDSQRAMITEKAHSILTVIYSFSEEDLADTLLDYQDLLEALTDAKNIELSIIDIPE